MTRLRVVLPYSRLGQRAKTRLTRLGIVRKEPR
jgi:hypothetical protein